MDKALDCWLWPEGPGVRWWTPAATGVLTALSPGDPGLINEIPALRDGRQESLASALAEDLYGVLAKLLNEHPGVLRLQLAEGLPADWHRFPFEYLRFKGRRLSERMLVMRYVPCTASPPLFPHSQEIAIFDLWPEEERSEATKGHRLFGDLIADLGTAILSRGINAIHSYLSHTDLSALSLLCVIGHGSERAELPPLRIAEDEFWSLPLDRGLPLLVILLVCGDDRYNLIHYGKTLLEAGAQTVLAPLGQLDAQPADAFLRDFLRGWQQGRRVDELLWEAQRKPGSEHGARRLLVLGRGALHRGPVRVPWEWQDKALAAAALEDGEALLALIERITLNCYQREGHLESAVDDLYEALGIDLDDRKPEQALLDRLDTHEARLSRLTRSWALPYLASLAEVYTHSLITKYKQLCHKLDAELQGIPPAPYVYHFRGKGPYRLGHYDEAVAQIIKGFALLDETRLCRRSGIGLLGLLVNCLIDLNLPVEGMVFYDRLDACLGGGDAFSHLQDINRLDRRARLALRQGEKDTALYNYRRKREIDNRDPDRDLAGLLYVTAWTEPEQGWPLAAEASDKLSADPNPLATMGKGNETIAYLLRAYALWAWRAGDEQAMGLLVQQIPLVQERLPVQDPGPLGLALGFMHLYLRDHPDAVLALPPWEIAEGALEDGEYWFELAVLSSLLGRQTQTARFLGRFHTMRKNALPHLEALPGWLGGGQVVRWRESLEKQAAQEKEVLLASKPPDTDLLVRTGLLPL